MVVTQPSLFLSKAMNRNRLPCYVLVTYLLLMLHELCFNVYMKTSSHSKSKQQHYPERDVYQLKVFKFRAKCFPKNNKWEPHMDVIRFREAIKVTSKDNSNIKNNLYIKNRNLLYKWNKNIRIYPFDTGTEFEIHYLQKSRVASCTPQISLKLW